MRAVRAALFAALCATLSATSHVLLSRTPLPVTMVAAVFAAMFLIAFATGRRERGFWAVAGLLVPLELAADTLFTTGQRTCYGVDGGPVTGPLRSLGADLVCRGGGVGPAGLTDHGAVAAVTDPGLPWLLLATHIGVGLLASWWLRRGEAAVRKSLQAAGWLAFSPLVRAVAVLCGFATPAVHRVTPAGAAAPRRSSSLTVTHSVVRRGPPRAVTA